MSEKRLLPAAALLVSSLKVIGKPDIIEIGALSDLRSYLFSQETVGYFLPLVTRLLTIVISRYAKSSLRNFIHIYISRLSGAILDGRPISLDSKTVRAT